MKKFWKIFGITLGSLLGVIIIAVLVAVYLVFTPARLTPIVRNVAANFITCEHSIGEVELTLFSTFPEVGLQVNGLYIINPMEGAPSDTLLAAPKVVATVNLTKFLRDNDLEVHTLSLDGAEANIFINKDGQTNFAIFPASTDTIQEPDTAAFSLPFDALAVDKFILTAPKIRFVSEQDSIYANIAETVLSAHINNWDDINLQGAIQALSLQIGEEQLADNLQFSMSLPHTGVDLNAMLFTLRHAHVGVNAFILHLNGTASLQDDIAVDMQAAINDWQVVEVLKLVPASYLSLLEGIDIDGGILSLTAQAKGLLNDSTMPIVDATLSLTDAQGAYKEVLPYYLQDIDLQAAAHLDLNDSLASTATIENLYATTGTTSITASGKVSELLADMLCDVKLNLNVHLPDVEYFIQDEGQRTQNTEHRTQDTEHRTQDKEHRTQNTEHRTLDKGRSLQGKMRGTAHAKIRLSDLTAMNLKRGNISGNLQFTGLDVAFDSMFVQSPKAELAFMIPNRSKNTEHRTQNKGQRTKDKGQRTKDKTNWIDATLKMNSLNFQMDDIHANIGESTLALQASDILSSDPVIYANLSLSSSALQAEMDSMAATIQQPALTAYVEYDTKDSTAIPTADVTVAFADLQGHYTDIVAHLAQSDLSAQLSGTRRDKSQPRLKATLHTASVQASMGADMKIDTKQLSLTAQARHNPKGENILLQWNPRLNVDFNEGVVDMASFGERIYIPKIQFDYNNRKANIQESQIILGNSDFALSGEVRNIGRWLRKKGVLEGELNFVSDHTDVNEIMLLVSADSGSEEEVQVQSSSSENSVTADMASVAEPNPFLVPTDVNLTLNTHIKEAVVFDQLARDLGGRLYVQDGILVLEEMGFICNAAKLQLTAMYKTPRRNHIYCGLDYHMIDINVQELVNMIPQIDTMMPMLRSFRGAAEFHLAAETYLNANYDLKTSTTRGACSISGKDLVLLDGETFSQIAKILLFSKKTENKIDSISVEATLFKKEIDIYPFCLSMDNYMAAVGGRHNLDMSFDYHIDLLSPLYIGVDVRGTFDDLQIKPAKVHYAKDFRPIFRREVDTQSAELKQQIKNSLRKNVKTTEED